MVFWNPNPTQFISALLNTSLAFFLFSYQVHEKSILLVAIPAIMAVKIFKGRYSQFMIFWFLTVTTFSMWPLLQKDGLQIAFLALQTIFIVMSHYFGLCEFELTDSRSEKINFKRSSPKPITQKDINQAFWCDWFIWTLFNFSLVGYLVLTLGSIYIEPPSQWPHIWPLLISVFSAVHFVLFWLSFNYCQWKMMFEKPIIVTEDKKKK